jgi:hypothetical protein
MATSSKKINYYQQDQILLKILKVIRALWHIDKFVKYAKLSDRENIFRANRNVLRAKHYSHIIEYYDILLKELELWYEIATWKLFKDDFFIK